MSPTHVAIVLAAGGSRRLGRPKQWLVRDGETLLRRAVRLAAQTRPQRLLVVLGADHQRLADELIDVEHERILNSDWAEGLASSLRLAAHAVGAALPALILGCDQPALAPEHLSRLLELANTASSGCAAANYADRFGIPAVVSPTMLTHSLALRGDRGLGQLLNALPGESVGRLVAPELALDIDTADDLQRAIDAGLVDGPRM
jgi:molybdenum cofactor cytidylyltransferase